MFDNRGALCACAALTPAPPLPPPAGSRVRAPAVNPSPPLAGGWHRWVYGVGSPKYSSHVRPPQPLDVVHFENWLLGSPPPPPPLFFLKQGVLPPSLSGFGEKRQGWLRGSPGKFAASPPPQDQILPPSTGRVEFAPPGLLLQFPVYVVYMGILGTCLPAGGGGKGFCAISRDASDFKVLGGLGAAGLGFPRSLSGGAGFHR